MPLTCPHCSRVNIGDARYCYYDGVSLSGAAGPAAASKSFLTPFVFPTGLRCNDYDEFASGCQRHWDLAVDMLHEGQVQSFFGGIGRMDLAQAAQEAAHFPDRDRGLDQLIARLPTSNIVLPKLDVQPKLINLGAMKVGETRTIELTLENTGQRLIFGSIASTCKWLAVTEIGEPKLFQFRDAVIAPIQVKGQHLRAGAKPLEGELLVESNAGTFKLKVIVSVPIIPFADGVLAGSKTPREVAEKSKASPKQAALAFENGSVGRWYAANGWVYPVQGPASNGVAAVQQFFEALGLSKPPRVSVNATQIELKGKPGALLNYQLKVSTEDNRPVFAYATCGESWLVIKPSISQGKVVTLPLEIAVPDRAGEVLETLVQVTSNGQQRFMIPMRLLVEAAVLEKAAITAALTSTKPPPNKTKSKADFEFNDRATPKPKPTASDRFDPVKLLTHVAPLLFLALLLFGLIARDVFSDSARQPVAINEEPPEERPDPKGMTAQFKVAIQDEPDENAAGSAVKFKIEDEPEERTGLAPVKYEIKDEPPEITPMQGGKAAPVDPTVRLRYAFGQNKRWGVVDAITGKKLTFAENGDTNTTILRLNGASQIFGAGAGESRNLPDDPAREAKQRSSFSYMPRPGLRVTQILEVMPSKQPVDIGKGQQRRRMDTLLVRYLFENTGKQPVNCGLRLEVDTLIGNNDGVPFTVPGLGFVAAWADFTEPAKVPDFVQALETGSLRDPGTIVHISLKVGGGIEAPSRVTLCHWSRNGDLSNIRPVPMGSDSAIIMVWPDQMLVAGQSREMGYGYGLGSVSATDPGGTLGVTLGGNFDIGQSFTVTAYVNKPVANQTVALELPPGLQRIKGEETQRVATPTIGTTSIVSWEAKVLQTGVFPVKVRSSTGITQTKTVTIARGDAPSGGKLSLDLQGAFEPGQIFRVIGNVNEPVAGQTLSLQLPNGLQKVGGATMQNVPAPPAGSRDSQVQWTVRVVEAGKYPVRVTSSTGVVQTKTITIAPSAGRTEGAFQILLTGDFAPGKTCTVAAKVANPVPGQKLTLVLPAGMKRVSGAESQDAQASADLAWKVLIEKEGKFSVGVKSTTGITQRKTVIIEPPSGQAGRFNFELEGDIRPGKEFTIIAKVIEPVAGQTLTLTLPKSLTLVKGEMKETVAAGVASRVTWTVRVVEGGRLPIRIESSTGLTRTKSIILAEPNSALFGR
jgi:hypothetical protein